MVSVTFIPGCSFSFSLNFEPLVSVLGFSPLVAYSPLEHFDLLCLSLLASRTSVA